MLFARPPIIIFHFFFRCFPNARRAAMAV
jgi:hypothetical protein